MQHLYLSRNNIFEIHERAFSGLETLYELDISHNLLTSAPSLVDLKSTLIILNLSWNRIISISESYFYSCTYIANINLNFNHLSDFPSIQAISDTIAVFSLEKNNISLVDPMYGVYFPRLTVLQLVSNQIESYCFPPRHFAPLLSDVYLQNNKLSTIQFSHVKSRSQKAHIFLDNNPWHCNNKLGWTEQCVQKTDSDMYCMGWLFLRDMICKSPLRAQGMTPKEAGWDPDSKIHGDNMGPTWVLPVPDGPHVGPMNFAIRGYIVAHNPSNRLVMFSTFQRALLPLLLTQISLDHYGDVIMGAIASQITSLTIVFSTVYLDADQRKHQSSASLAFVRGIHRGRWIPRTNGQ